MAKQGESFGNVLAESLLCETPAVVLNSPWDDNSQAEVVGNSVGGFSANTVAGFERAVEALVGDRKLRARLGKQGRQRIKQRYGADAVAEAALDALETKRADVDVASVPQQLLDSYDGLGSFGRWCLKREYFGTPYKYYVGFKSLR